MGLLVRRKECGQFAQVRTIVKCGQIGFGNPHINAGEERVFSLIKQNKTPIRSSLNANGTLSSIIQIKLANTDSCIKWKPSKDLLKAAKTATKQYNTMHKK